MCSLTILKLPRVVVLSEIYPHLYLSNFEYVEQPCQILRAHKIDYIINLSQYHLKTNIPSSSISFVDSRSIRYDDFVFIINNIVQKIRWCIVNQLHVVVNCSAGCERSVSSVIAYAIYYTNNRSTKYWLQYIENCKLQQGYSNWSSLKNTTFLRDLLFLEQSLFMDGRSA